MHPLVATKRRPRVSSFGLGLVALFSLGGPLSLLSAQSPGSGASDGCNPYLTDCSASQQGAGNVIASGGQQPGSTGMTQRTDSQGNQLYVDSAGTQNSRQTTDSPRNNQGFTPEPVTDMQRLGQAATGERLPIFGRDLFQRPLSTFAPTDQIPVLPDYTVGPGDEILLRLWGPESFNGQLTVDSSGSIYVPQVGAIHVAGLRADQLQAQITAELRHSFRNFNLSVNLGHLRSIQVYVVGEARRPGAYTVSSLSTVLNVLFVSGGPDAQGSMRHIQVRRAGAVVGELDLYDLILRGDKSKDMRLEPNDTIFIPAATLQVALAGSVRHPGIYEILPNTTIDDLLQISGGFTPTASPTQISLDRIEGDLNRLARTIRLDPTGRGTVLRDGDVLFANHITTAFEKTVTIRGNLASPGRFAWHPGMRLSEIIPERQALLTSEYWRERNRLGLPAPLFEPLRPTPNRPQANSLNGDRTQANPASSAFILNAPQQITADNFSTSQAEPSRNNTSASTLNQDATDNQDATANTQTRRTGINGEPEQLITSSDTALTRGSLAEEQQASNVAVGDPGRRNTVVLPTPEIDWSYAVIERLDPMTLKSVLVPFNLGGLVQNHDSAQDLELQPGDIVSIFSQADIHVPQDEQTKYVRLEGEFKGAGVYSVAPNETLEDLVVRAGGLSSKAYLYGASFTRESARIFQQQRLDEYVSSVALNMQRAAAQRAASSSNPVLDPTALVEQRDIVAQLRQLRATGRIVLEFTPQSTGNASVPGIPLENGDVFRVPSKPLTVAVIGAVYGQNVFLYDSRRRVEDYLTLAGKPNPIADHKHAFIIRADGSVFSRERAKGLWKNSFEAIQINPGDAIVVPEKPIRPSFIRQFIDYSQLFSQFALGAAALSVIKN